MKRKSKYVVLPIDKVKPNMKNPRKGMYDQIEMDELKENIEAIGQLTPIKVDKDYIILGGHRRHFAMKQLGLKTIKAEILTNLSNFDRSAILFSDNTTQKSFNAWDSRKAIADIYWNEFSDEYTFKSTHDKGYGEFAKRLGISSSTVRHIIESMSKENMDFGKKLEKAGLGTEVFDTIVKSPQKYRKQLLNKALELADGKKAATETSGGIREQLRMYKKAIKVQETLKDEIHPNFYSSIITKINSLGIVLTKDLSKKSTAHDKLKLKKAIEQNILPFYKLLK